MPVKFKVITPKLPNVSAMAKPYTRAMEQTTLIAEDMFEATVRTWEDEPKFKRKVKASTTKIVGSVTTDSEQYKFVTRGTKVRYARMTSDFEAKTQPGLIDSRQGSGGVLYIDTSRPLPGIEARRFEEEIAKKTEPILEKEAEEASREAARKSGHAI